MCASACPPAPAAAALSCACQCLLPVVNQLHLSERPHPGRVSRSGLRLRLTAAAVGGRAEARRRAPARIESPSLARHPRLCAGLPARPFAVGRCWDRVHCYHPLPTLPLCPPKPKRASSHPAPPPPPFRRSAVTMSPRRVSIVALVALLSVVGPCAVRAEVGRPWFQPFGGRNQALGGRNQASKPGAVPLYGLRTS